MITFRSPTLDEDARASDDAVASHAIGIPLDEDGRSVAFELVLFDHVLRGFAEVDARPLVATDLVVDDPDVATAEQADSVSLRRDVVAEGAAADQVVGRTRRAMRRKRTAASR